LKLYKVTVLRKSAEIFTIPAATPEAAREIVTTLKRINPRYVLKSDVGTEITSVEEVK
jgi:hypothetical protein